MMRTLSCGAALALLVAPLSTFAEEKMKPATPPAKTGAMPVPSPHMILPASEVKFGEGPPGLPKGAQLAVMHGDPGKPGLFMVQLKFPAGFKVPAHTHPSDEHVTVLSGEVAMGMGPKFEEGKLKTLPPGSFATMPAGHQHFATAKKESVILLTGQGPFEITYVNPADDPRNAKKPSTGSK